MFKKMIKRWRDWYNHERTLCEFARSSSFTLSQIKQIDRQLNSYEKLERAIDLASEKNISLYEAAFRIRMGVK